MIKVLLFAGARPNFMKIAPIFWEMSQQGSGFTPYIVHTGQHYDRNMSGRFFDDLELPAPHFSFNVGSGSHAAQTAAIMVKTEELCQTVKPDWIIVVGDVNSTLGAALAATKLHIPVAHVEAGLRSRDRHMPEEINRLATDAISDLLLTPSRDANENLHAEGVPKGNIAFVGNVMIDSLVKVLPQLENIPHPTQAPYFIATIHRPKNVDSRNQLGKICALLEEISNSIQLVFPLHPRTKASLQKFDLLTKLENNTNIHLHGPQPYKTFIAWLQGASAVVTDSGGIQEETTFLGVPCLTLRESTERPVTITEGTNQLVQFDNLIEKIQELSKQGPKNGQIPELWDGKAGIRIINAIKKHHAYI